MSEDIIKWIECSEAFRGKEQLFKELFKKYASAQKALDHARQRGSALRKVTSGMAEKILESCSKSGIQPIAATDISYPHALDAVTAPIVLYVKGDPQVLLSRDPVGIIGARHPSDYSIRICTTFSKELARNKRVIISGFAPGIDRCAHLNCIREGSKTIAVLGCGIGFDYPYGSAEIQKEIAASGAVISEYPPYSKPVRTNFTHHPKAAVLTQFPTPLRQAQMFSSYLPIRQTWRDTVGRRSLYVMVHRLLLSLPICFSLFF